MTLAQSEVGAKTNETTRLRPLLEPMDLIGTLVIFDTESGAMGDMWTGQKEFERLGAFLAELDPRHSAARPPGALDTDAPRRLAALWRGIGVSEVSMPQNPWTSLSAAESRQIMSEIFEEWFDSVQLRDRWGVEADDYRAAWDRLPSRFRVVAAANPPERRTVLREVALTDESTGLDDPPAVVFSAEGKPAILWHSSHVQWQIWTMLRGRKGARWTSFDARCGLTDPQVLPTVYPRLETLAEGVWHLREPGLLRQDVRPLVRRHLLQLVGELDMATVPLLEQAVSACLAEHSHRIHLDLAHLRFCDGTGLQALRHVTDAAWAAHVAVCLAGIHPHLHRTLSRLGTALPWFLPVIRC